MGRANREEHPEFFNSHRIVVSVATRRRRWKLHTFASTEHDCWASAGYDEMEMVPAVRHDPWDWAGRGPLADIPVAHLATGVDIPTPTLIFILDALRFYRRHKVDLDDIKRVVSQLGSQISRVGELPTISPADGLDPTPPDGRRIERMTVVDGRLEPTGEIRVTPRRHAIDALYSGILARCTTV